MTGDPLELIGAPYVLGAKDPVVGFDCWTLLCYVRREYFALATPAIAPEAHEPASAMDAFDESLKTGLWIRVNPPGAPGDVVGMSAVSTGSLHHVGVALPGGVLHAWSGLGGYKTGSVVLTPWERATRIFKQLEVFRCRS